LNRLKIDQLLPSAKPQLARFVFEIVVAWGGWALNEVENRASINSAFYQKIARAIHYEMTAASKKKKKKKLAK